MCAYVRLARSRQQHHYISRLPPNKLAHPNQGDSRALWSTVVKKKQHSRNRASELLLLSFRRTLSFPTKTGCPRPSFPPCCAHVCSWRERKSKAESVCLHVCVRERESKREELWKAERNTAPECRTGWLSQGCRRSFRVSKSDFLAHMPLSSRLEGVLMPTLCLDAATQETWWDTYHRSRSCRPN